MPEETGNPSETGTLPQETGTPSQEAGTSPETADTIDHPPEDPSRGFRKWWKDNWKTAVIFAVIALFAISLIFGFIPLPRGCSATPVTPPDPAIPESVVTIEPIPGMPALELHNDTCYQIVLFDGTSPLAPYNIFAEGYTVTKPRQLNRFLFENGGALYTKFQRNEPLTSQEHANVLSCMEVSYPVSPYVRLTLREGDDASPPKPGDKVALITIRGLDDPVEQFGVVTRLQATMRVRLQATAKISGRGSRLSVSSGPPYIIGVSNELTIEPRGDRGSGVYYVHPENLIPVRGTGGAPSITPPSGMFIPDPTAAF